jgi:hypothetical protein
MTTCLDAEDEGGPSINDDDEKEDFDLDSTEGDFDIEALEQSDDSCSEIS